MKRSNFFIPFKRDVKAEQAASAAYMERMGMVHMLGAGMYTHLPLGYKVFQNLKTVLSRHLLAAGCAEHQFPAIQPITMWEESGRLEIFGDSIFTLTDQHGRAICLAPTHEVAAAFTAKAFIKSYRDMPVRISQIQTKFRDEARPRAGVIRTREFTMHDLYSFDTGIGPASDGYERIRKAYEDTLTELRVPFVVVEQEDMGPIGGVRSHEFHVLTDVGEDIYRAPDGTEHKSLEIAHIFMLGDKYTQPIGARYKDQDGSEKPIFMCSFGLGIERTAAAFIEKNYRPASDMPWSWALAPFKVMVLGQDVRAAALYQVLRNAGYDPLIEDRDVPFSQQLREGLALGLPVYIIFGRAFASDRLLEVRIPRLNKVLYLGEQELLERLPELTDEVKGIELVQMAFTPLHIDLATRAAYIHVSQIEDCMRGYCPIEEVPPDVLGNFVSRRSAIRLMKAGPFRVTPVVVDPATAAAAVRAHERLPYIVAPSLDGLNYDNLGRLMTAFLRG